MVQSLGDMGGGVSLIFIPPLSVNMAVSSYIRVFPHQVAESPQESQAHAHVLVQDPAHTDERGQSLADQSMTIFQKP